MKGIFTLILFALLGLSAYNYWEIHTLRQEIAELNQKVNVQSQSGITDEVVAKAVIALAQARDSMNKMDATQARAAYETARKRLDEAATTANRKAGPTVKWLRDEASDLGRQLQSRFHSP